MGIPPSTLFLAGLFAVLWSGTAALSARAETAPPRTPNPVRHRLQVLNGGPQPLRIFRLESDGGRVESGSVDPDRDTFLDASPGQRFLLVPPEGAASAVVTSTVPVQAFRYDPSDPEGIPAYYTQRIRAQGYPIVASARVNPYALKEAAHLVDLLLAKRPDIREAMIRSGSRLCILAWNEFTTDQPEFARLAKVRMPERPDLSGRDFWDSRARGLGGSETDPFCSCGEENLLGYPGDPYASENILIHEFAHNLHLRGLLNVDPTFDGRLRAAYDAAMKAGLWKGKYAASNHHEYFAEGVQSWFDNNREDDHDHNHVNTRQELLDYDPALAALCREVFGDTVLRYTQPRTRVTGHLAGWDPAASPRFEWPERLRRPKPSSKPSSASASASAPKGTNVAVAMAPVVGGLESGTPPKPRIAGAVLLGELACTACHVTDHVALAPKPGPDLSQAGRRIRPGHLRRFLAQPSAAKPGTTMPDVLAALPDAERESAADALAHYLTSLATASAPAEPAGTGDAERGRSLYQTIGCAACHPSETAAGGPVPLGPLAGKYSASALAEFLQDPRSVRPSGRMPDLRLEAAEARDIAAHLRSSAAPEIDDAIPAPDAALVRRGRELFLRHRCAACHRTGDPVVPSPASGTALARLDPQRGCLAETIGDGPRYRLSDVQRTAIRAALDQIGRPFEPAEELGIGLLGRNCIACHRREGLGGPTEARSTLFTGTDPNLGEAGRLPPSLTGVGAKLKPAALRDTIANGHSVRPYLHTRMPRFGAETGERLATAFKRVDTLPAVEFRRVTPEEKPHDVGRRLAGSKGLNCIACHTFRGHGVSPLRALDLMTMAERLEETWFHRYLADPARFSPQTIMPAFWADGKSPLPDLLGGDPARQRDALGQWLSEGPEAGDPQGLVLERLEIAVKDEAVVIRRAFPGIGKRGLGVGYPSGIHLAFDAGQLRLGSLWSGGFAEASGIWRGQGAGQVHLLGRDRVTFPAGPAFVVLPSADAPWPTNVAFLPDGVGFRGYSLEERRRPAFRYESDGITWEDRFLDVVGPEGRPYFVRTLTPAKGTPPTGLRFRVAADPELQPLGGEDYAVGRGLRVRLSVPGTLRESGGMRELLVPVTGGFRVEYHLENRR